MFVAWRDLIHARGRFALMLAVVALIAVLVGLLSGLTAGLARQSTSAVTDLKTSQLVFSAEPISFASSRVPLPAKVEGTPLGFATSRLTAGERSAAVTVIGIPVGTSVAPDAEGIKPGAVVLSTLVATDLDVVAGEQVTVAGQRFEVTAVRGDASFSHIPVVWLTLADWQRVTGSGESATVLATDTAGAPPGMVNVSRSDALTAIGSYTAENGSLQMIRGFLFAISALVIGAFFTVWTIQRSRDIAVLRALGASTRYLLRDAVGQAVVLLLAGAGLGAVVVVAVGLLAGGSVPFVLSLGTVGAPLLVLVAVGVVGALLAVRRVTSVDPLTALGSAR